MSDKRRSKTVLLGTLAAGAVLGAALGATAGTDKATSISDQFRGAFTPGTVQIPESMPQIVVSEG
jgi:hypothetical protein